LSTVSAAGLVSDKSEESSSTATDVRTAGVVRDVAQISVNGTPLGITWAAPFRVYVTSALKPGVNRVEVRVTNEWTNRLIGDRSLPAEKKVLGNSGVTVGGFGANAVQAPPESGLIGPVTLIGR
jgi:hypothetical protein